MPPDSAILQQALEWQVTFWSGEISEDERHAFQRWLNMDERHAAAWKQVQTTDNTLASITAPGAAPALRFVRQSVSKRKSLRVLGLFIGAGLVTYTVRQTPQWQGAMADYHTVHGERKDISLPDGTKITLNASSAIDVFFDDTRRLVRLRSGEIFVATAPDPLQLNGHSRAFIIQTAEGSIRPIGTLFNVRQESNKSRVAVIEGAVAITPLHDANNSIRLMAGQQTSFSDTQVAEIDSISATVAAWRHGVLVAERMRLKDLIIELARYRRGFLRCDDAIGNLVVSGVYSIDDTDAALTSLVDALPIRVQYVSRYWVTVQPM